MMQYGFSNSLRYRERSFLPLKKETAQRTPVFGFKLFLLSSYLHVDGYKIPSNFDLYNNKTKANLQTKFKHTWKTNKMQINKTAVGKGDTVLVKLSLCCCGEEVAQGRGASPAWPSNSACAPPAGTTRLHQCSGMAMSQPWLDDSVFCLSAAFAFSH